MVRVKARVRVRVRARGACWLTIVDRISWYEIFPELSMSISLKIACTSILRQLLMTDLGEGEG